MKKTIYIQLLEEGTVVYRPVSAEKLSDNIYKVLGHDIYDLQNERREFPPNTIVVVEEKPLEGSIQLIEIKKYVK